MNSDLKILSLLLSYPQQELQEACPLLKVTLDELSNLDAAHACKIKVLIDFIHESDLYDVQEEYVSLFDRSRSLSLHLFEHVHGESRDRGQAMVDLKNMYDDAGFDIDSNEMPDFLPMFLEFLSTRPRDEAEQSLADILHIISAIKHRLDKRNSPYAAAFAAIENLAHNKADQTLLHALLAQEEDDPNNLDALDKVWEEETITFGGNAGENACGPDRLRTRLRAAQRDVATPNT